MAEAVVTFALEEIQELLSEEIRLLSGVGHEVEDLEKQLKEMKCLIEDADRRRHESKTFANLIAEIRDLAFEAEDAIEKYAARVSFKRQQRGAKKLLRRYACILKEYHSLHQLGLEIAKIKSGLESVSKKLGERGVMSKIMDGGESSAASDNQHWERMTYSNFVIGDHFVGMQDELEQLVSLVADHEPQRAVVSVWGMGGLGKTTIARNVYNRIIETKRGGFECFAWVCITQQCQVQSVLKEVLEQLDPEMRKVSASSMIPQKGEYLPSLSMMQLHERLWKIQRAKRCLIVVDDLWETFHWDGLKNAFLDDKSKTKILVTTREEKVAHIGYPYKLKLLNKEDAWELLKIKALPQDFPIEEKRNKIGREMVRKCGYLPLAISLLGGVLRRKKPTMEQWEEVNDNIKAHIFPGEGHDEKDNPIYQVLSLSYENLPYYLKPCFLHLGTFNEDESIPVREVYWKWIAQGLISNENNIRGKEKTLMGIAELHLNELASRSLVQIEDDDVLPLLRKCKLHDVVREECLSMGEKEDFGLQIMECEGDGEHVPAQANSSHIKTRHLIMRFRRELEEQHGELAITRARGEDISKHLRSLISKHLRSLRIVNHESWNPMEFPPQSLVDFEKIKLLRDLVIVGFKFAGRKLPKGVTNLVHLRSLVLQDCELDKLPSSLSSLVYLNTLDLLDSRNVRVPNVLKKMFRLKHLILPSYDSQEMGDYRLRLDEVSDELETLIGFDSSVHELKSITGMKNLRHFAGLVNDNESFSAIMNAIYTKWNKLTFCEVAIGEGCELITTGSEEGLMKLKQAFKCPRLHCLVIEVELGKLLVECRSDLMSSRLVTLFLSECKIKDDPMGVLGNIPNLKELVLGWRSFVGEEMTCPSSSFPSLKKLDLSGLPNLREWIVGEGAMHHLSQLCIVECPLLEMVPDGLSRISTLKILEIYGMPKLGIRVSPYGDDFHKVRHVLYIHINN